jgi:hypothetical protein
MVCTHLRELYQLCEKHDLRLGGAELVRLVCRQCQQEETCPSILMDEYDAREAARDAASEVKAKPDPSA